MKKRPKQQRAYAKARPRHQPGRMNQTENRYAQQLAARQAAGEVLAWEFEPLKFRLGLNWKCTYTPDFLVHRADGLLELVDVKGSGPPEDDAVVKMQAVARLYPQFVWVVATEGKGKSGRGKFARRLVDPDLAREEARRADA